MKPIRMIWNEIRKRYPDEWVLLAEKDLWAKGQSHR